MKNPYEVLGVKKSVDSAEIKKAYRRLAKKLHPDLNPGNKVIEKRFKDITAAYEILSDVDKRRRYDSGQINSDGSMRHGAGFRHTYDHAGGGEFRFRESGVDISGVFSELFGQGGSKHKWSNKVKGKDFKVALQLSFLEVANGVSRRIKLPNEKFLDVNIPPATPAGRSLRLRGQGEAGKGGGSSGDVYIELQVETHKLFERQGLDIYLDLPVTLSEALIGAQISVPTIKNNVMLTIPANSNSGTKLRLKGKGIATANGRNKGDQYITLKVMLPEKGDQELVEFIRRWSKANEYRVRC